MTAHQTAWQHQHLALLTERFGDLQRLPEGTLHDQVTPFHHIRIIKHGQQIHFYFVNPVSGTLEGPMSRIDLERPLHLLAEYTQAAMLSLLWRPEPARACLLGLAGGRLSLVLYHHFPALVIDNIEIDPAVGSIAERFFGLTFDTRQQLMIGDAYTFLAERHHQPPYDMIVMDAFSDTGDNLDRLATAEFYRCCLAQLLHNGVVCVNLLRGDAQFAAKAETFATSFRHTQTYQGKRGLVLFGSNGRRLNQATIAQQATRLAAHHGFDFPFAQRAATLSM